MCYKIQSPKSGIQTLGQTESESGQPFGEQNYSGRTASGPQLGPPMHLGALHNAAERPPILALATGSTIQGLQQLKKRSSQKGRKTQSTHGSVTVDGTERSAAVSSAERHILYKRGGAFDTFHVAL